MRILFMGTPDFAVPSLEALIDAGYRPVAVVTAPDRKRGRGQQVAPTPVKVVAERHGIPVLQPASVRAPAFAEEVAALAPDVIVVVAFKILPPEVFTQARLGAFNLHASLLPAFRGAAPIQRALMAGVEETGVTTFFLERTVDTGNVILKRSLPVGPEETAGELHDRLMHLGAEAVVETVRRIDHGTVETEPQDDTLASPAPKVFRDDARVDWEAEARIVHNFVRGLSPVPAAWTMHGDVMLKIYRTRIAEGAGALGQPGEVLQADDRFVVACRAGAVELLEVQQPGRRTLDAPTFLHGYSIEPGDRLG